MTTKNDLNETRSLRQMLRDIAAEPAEQEPHHETGPSDEAVSRYLMASGFDLDVLERQRVDLLNELDDLERAEGTAAKAGLPGMSVTRRGARVLTSISARTLPLLHDLFMPEVPGFAGTHSPAGARSGQSEPSSRTILDDPVPNKAATVEWLVAQGSKVVLVDWAPSEDGSKLTLFFVQEWPASVPALRVVVDDRVLDVTEDDLIEIPSSRLLHILLPVEYRALRADRLDQADDALGIEIETVGEEGP